jgi:hypothetical protein
MAKKRPSFRRKDVTPESFYLGPESRLFILFSSVELELKQPKPSIGTPFHPISCTAPQFHFGVGKDAKKPIGDSLLAPVFAFN